MTDGIDIVDSIGIIRQMNQAGYRLVGLKSQEEAPTYFDKTPQARSQMLMMRDEQGQPIPPERAPAARIVRGEILAGKSAMDVQVRTIDGREREWEFSGAPTRDGAGNINGGVVMFHDVTERRAWNAAPPRAWPHCWRWPKPWCRGLEATPRKPKWTRAS